MESKKDLLCSLQGLQKKITERKHGVQEQINDLEDNTARQKIRADFVKEKSKDVLRAQTMLYRQEVKEEASGHLVKTMDFISNSDTLLKDFNLGNSNLASTKVGEAMRPNCNISFGKTLGKG